MNREPNELKHTFEKMRIGQVIFNKIMSRSQYEKFKKNLPHFNNNNCAGSNSTGGAKNIQVDS
jgi:hypothetical protein